MSRHTPPRAPTIAVVTDSAAGLAPAAAADAGILVVPLTVTIGDDSFTDRPEHRDRILTAITTGEVVTTSQPTPVSFADTYEAAADAGGDAIISVHLSGKLSGTVHAAGLAAQNAPVPVHVVDTGTAGAAQGAVALAAAGLSGGENALVVAARAVALARASRTWVLVESLDHLRRGGRLGRTASAVGTALGMRPVLELRGGSIDLAQVVRGRRSGLDRLLKLAYGQAVERARAGERSTVCVQYVDDRDGAQDFADLILARVAREIADSTAEGAVFADAGAPDVTTEQVAGVLMAHLGPAIVAVSVFPSIGR